VIHQVVVTDVTEMRASACVAGIHLGAHRTVRLATPNPTLQQLDGIGGLIPGSLVTVDWTADAAPRPPHVEDGHWVPGTLQKTGQLDEDGLLALLDRDSFRGVVQAFGEPVNWGSSGNASYSPGQGSRSLATVRCTDVELAVWPDRVRVNFIDRDGRRWRAVPLQDLAVKRHRVMCKACARQFEQTLRREFEGPGRLLRVGLAREWNGGCWLQVNAIFLGKRNHFVPFTAPR